MSDRPLTDAQERCLIELAKRNEGDGMWRTVGTGLVRGDVVARLEALGFAETTYERDTLYATITAEGEALLASMGD